MPLYTRAHMRFFRILTMQDAQTQEFPANPADCNCLAIRQAARQVTQLYDGYLAAAACAPRSIRSSRASPGSAPSPSTSSPTRWSWTAPRWAAPYAPWNATGWSRSGHPRTMAGCARSASRRRAKNASRSRDPLAAGAGQVRKLLRSERGGGLALGARTRGRGGVRQSLRSKKPLDDASPGRRVRPSIIQG